MTDARPEQTSDADLVAACRAGDREAFGELVGRYQDRLYTLAFRLTGNRDDADEAAQEAFLKAYRNLGSFRGDSAFYTWLFRIAVNEIRSRHRFKAVRPTEVSLESGRASESERAADRFESKAADPSEEASRRERKRIVEDGLGRLDPEQRMMILLRDIEGRDYEEIAAILDCPRGTVKSRLHRARMALKEFLQPILGATGE